MHKLTSHQVHQHIKKAIPDAVTVWMIENGITKQNLPRQEQITIDEYLDELARKELIEQELREENQFLQNVVGQYRND